MGTYTRLHLSFKLKKDTPDEVINVLKRIIIDDKIDKTINNVPFFNDCLRWYHLFQGKNCEWQLITKMFFNKHYWCIEINSEFKNYDNEIELFLDWIKHYIIGRKKLLYLGYSQIEGYGYNRIYFHLDTLKQEII